MPSVNPNESQQHYVSRAIPIIIHERRRQGKKISPEQAQAIAFSMYRQHQKKKALDMMIKSLES